MARPRTLCCSAAVLWGLFLVAAVAGAPGASERPGWDRAPRTAIAGLSGASDAALLPGRMADDVRAAAYSGGSLRVLLLPAVLAAVLGIPAARRRRGGAPAHDHRVLQTRRHVIGLRAPPLQLT